MKNWSIEKLRDIWQLASELHFGQQYGGPKEGQQFEYINHIGSVTFEILNALQYSDDLDPDLALPCALLHDSIEDTSYTYEEVKARFGTPIADGVSALTKNAKLPDKSTQMQDSLRRIKAQPQSVWAVKLADRIVNLSEPPFYWSNEKKAKYLKEAQLIYDALKDANRYLAKRLQEKMKQYQTYISE